MSGLVTGEPVRHPCHLCHRIPVPLNQALHQIVLRRMHGPGSLDNLFVNTETAQHAFIVMVTLALGAGLLPKLRSRYHRHLQRVEQGGRHAPLWTAP